MNVKKLLVALVVCHPAIAETQGFAGLGTQADGFSVPQRGHSLTFPSDHGAHPDYRIEWWYLTANLKGPDDRNYGVQWTLFRSALGPGVQSGWASPQIWMGHAGLTTPGHQFYAERLARGGIGQAGVTTEPFSAWIDNWELKSFGPGLSQLALIASGQEFSYDLKMTAKGPLVLHGDGGYSVKSATGQASYYYSLPGYGITGSLTLPDGPIAVTGQGWLDREWSSQPLAADQSGWDWFSLSFDSGAKLMGFVLRGEDDYFRSGTWIDADGSSTPLQPGSFHAEPLDFSIVEGRTIPVKWQINLPEYGVTAIVEALNKNSWMGTSFPYWEGPVSISGSHTGFGYLEMTGYE